MALHIMVEENAAMIITITIPNVVLQKKKNIKIINIIIINTRHGGVYARKPSSLLIDYGDADHSCQK